MNAPEKLPAKAKPAAKKPKAKPAPAPVATPAQPAPQDDNTLRIPTRWLAPSATNPRKTFSGIEELAASIRVHDIVQPLVVRPWPASVPWTGAETAPAEDRYEIVAGERRWRAACLAERRDVPVILRDLADDQVLDIQLVERIAA